MGPKGGLRESLLMGAPHICGLFERSPECQALEQAHARPGHVAPWTIHPTMGFPTVGIRMRGFGRAVLRLPLLKPRNPEA